MSETKQPEALSLAQECANYAASLRSTAVKLRLEHGREPAAIAQAADLFERAGANIAQLERWQDDVRNNSNLVNCWEKAEARAAELEAQMSAIGAGGVEPLRKREQPAFYVRDHDVLALADKRVAGRGAMLSKEGGAGMTAFYASAAVTGEAA